MKRPWWHIRYADGRRFDLDVDASETPFISEQIDGMNIEATQLRRD